MTAERSKRGTRIAALLFSGAVLGALVGFFIGLELAPPAEGPARADTAATRPAAKTAPSAVVWTCSMHPQIRRSGPGKCPICGMDLIPADSAAGGGGVLALSEEGMALAEVRTVEVARAPVETEVRMVGKVAVDETRVHAVTSWVPGRIDRLFVDFTGTRVRKGDHLAFVYSPELIAAQQEYLSARKALAEVLGRGTPTMRQASEDAVAAARDKLLLLGMNEDWIARLEARGRPEDRVVVTSEYSGLVLKKRVDVGDYVKTGQTLFDVADLGQVYIHLLAYEQDLALLRYGQDVAITIEALPGEVFHGRISLLYPVLDEETRTLALRVIVKNPGERLRPGMFARAVVRVRLDREGRPRAPDFTQAYICPMHPEVVREQPGTCPICEMPLVQGKDLGLEPPAPAGDPLVVPASAVLFTGKRSVVWVRLPGKEPRFVAKEILLGPRAGDRYVVLAGLMEGELVVTDGAFKLDSEAQIRALPSMMNPKGMQGRGVAPAPRAPQGRKPSAPELATIVRGYLAAHAALFRGDAAGGRAALLGLRGAAPGSAAAKALQGLSAESSEEDVKAAFDRLTQALLADEAALGGLGLDLSRMHCPMAFGGRGADWLQRGTKVENPWFGPKMPGCGELVKRYGPPARSRPHGPGRRAPGAASRPLSRPASGPASRPRGKVGLPVEPARRALERYLAAWRALAGDEPAAAARELAALAREAPESAAARALAPDFGPKTGQSPPRAKLLAAFRRLGDHLAKQPVVHAVPGLVRAHCPMAFGGKGADWLQIGEEIKNPYYGSMMLGCGSVVERYGPKTPSRKAEHRRGGGGKSGGGKR